MEAILIILALIDVVLIFKAGEAISFMYEQKMEMKAAAARRADHYNVTVPSELEAALSLYKDLAD